MHLSEDWFRQNAASNVQREARPVSVAAISADLLRLEVQSTATTSNLNCTT
jgi:hypothetical protein